MLIFKSCQLLIFIPSPLPKPQILIEKKTIRLTKKNYSPDEKLIAARKLFVVCVVFFFNFYYMKYKLSYNMILKF